MKVIAILLSLAIEFNAVEDTEIEHTLGNKNLSNPQFSQFQYFIPLRTRVKKLIIRTLFIVLHRLFNILLWEMGIASTYFLGASGETEAERVPF